MGAEAGFHRMPAEPGELEPDQVVWNIMVNACAKAKDLPKAETWASRMLASVVPGHVMSFTAIIMACARSGAARKADAWFKEMEEHAGVKRDRIIYNAMLKA